MAKNEKLGAVKPPLKEGTAPSEPNLIDPKGRYEEPKTDKKPSESPEPR